MAALKLSVQGGKIGVITAYAPHNLKPLDERRQFYTELCKLWERTSVNGPRYFLGDFNARVAFQKPGESDCFGPCGFGREAVHKVECPNRELLYEFCSNLGYAVGNMFAHTPDSQKVTFMEAGSFPYSSLTAQNFD